MPTLESRIAALEHQNRLLRSTLLLSVVGLVTCGGVTSNYERVNTNTLVIVDDQDQRKITLAANGQITFHGPGAPVVLDGETLSSLLAARANTPGR